MSGEVGVAVVAAIVVVASYWTGRIRLGLWLDRWADSKVGGPHGASWWAAQAVMAAEVGWLLAAHPRRTKARLRDVREFKRVPAPQFDTDWAAKRRAGSEESST